MKKTTSALVFLTSISAWLGALIIVPWMTSVIQKMQCENLAANECRNIISTLGATGDIFGAITSLFSGLALFAVALTLWADSNSRRESRKPFVMTQLTPDSLMLIEPNLTGERKIKLIAKLDIANQLDEAALNIKLKSRLIHQTHKTELPESNLTSPLMGNKSDTLEVESEIKGKNFDLFLAELTAGNSIDLITDVEYESIEGVRWQTSVTYEVTCTATLQRNRLNSARGNNEDFEEQWKNNAAVSLSPSPRSGTWKHKKI